MRTDAGFVAVQAGGVRRCAGSRRQIAMEPKWKKVCDEQIWSGEMDNCISLYKFGSYDGYPCREKESHITSSGS